MDYRFFKTALAGGFDKKAVLDYIGKMNVDNKINKEKLEKEIKETKIILDNVISEKQLLTKEINELAVVNRKLESEKNSLSDEIDKFQNKYDDIAKILLEIEEKRKIAIEEADRARVKIISDAKVEADKIIKTAKEVSSETISTAQIKYDQITEATVELANLIDNSKRIFNKISDETINLVKTTQK